MAQIVNLNVYKLEKNSFSRSGSQEGMQIMMRESVLQIYERASLMDVGRKRY